jgi:putative peptide zinc metalloprotease protein
VGANVPRGTPLGAVIDPQEFEFVATVLQADADKVFGSATSLAGAESQGAEVRLRGQAANRISVNEWKSVSGGQQRLPSPALGWMAGGEVPVTNNQPDEATEPFFEVHAALASSNGTLLHGQSGEIRFDLPSEPLLPRWWRRFRQLLQKRYQV